MQKNIALELLNPATGEAKDFRFRVTSERYNNLKNAMAGRDKTAPVYNFAVGCCHPDDRSEFIALAQSEEAEGIADIVAERLLDEFLPKIQVTVKKPSTSPTASKEMTTATDS